MTQSHLIVKEEGICIYRVPDGSEFAENFQDGSGTGRYDEQGYQEAVKQAQSSAILVEDQKRAIQLMAHGATILDDGKAQQHYCKIGSIYPVPGIEFQIIYKQIDDCTDECEDDCMCYHDEARARLIEHTAEKEETINEFCERHAISPQTLINVYNDNLKRILAESPEIDKEKYLLIDVFADNGEHSHWALIERSTGIKVWSEDPEECKAQGYPVKP